MRTRHAAATLLAVMTTAACGDGVVQTSELGDDKAVWELTTTVDSNTYGLDDGSSSTDRIILIRCGNEVSLIAGNGLWGAGTARGEDIDLTGT
jgi:hypothetical protein